MSRRNRLTLAEQETIILWDNELDTANVYTHDQRIANKLRELEKKYPVPAQRKRCTSFRDL